jgi:regulator of cell morphogenesis and NO signaling
MQTITEKTVREIAVENPASIRVFETLGIDYCCGGKKSLADACSHADIDVDRLLDLLSKADLESNTPVSAEWSGKPLRDLIAHIVLNHHGYVRRETPRIESLLSKVVSKHGSARPELLQIEQLFTAIGQELSTHILKEEQVLFPYIERMEQAALKNEYPLPPAFFGSVKRPIANMMAEHDDAGALLSRIRKLSDGYKAPGGACPTFLALYRGLEEFERDLHHHVHLENNILFPRAVEMEQAQFAGA